MRLIVVALAVVVLTALTVGDAHAIQNSIGRVEVGLSYWFKPDGEAKAKGKAEGENFDLQVGFDTVYLDGRLTTIIKPIELQVDTGFTFQIPTLADKATNKKVKTKIPVLGDIPLVGDLFKTKSETESFLSLMIFVNPMLIDPVEKTQKEPVVLGGAVDIETYKASGKVSIVKKFTFYKGKMKLKISGKITTGPHAGKDFKGLVKIKFSGNRAG